METTHLQIRPSLPEDAPALFRLTSDPAVTHYMRFSTHMAPRQAEELIKSYTAPGCAGFTLVEKATGRYAGVIALKPEGRSGEYSVSVMLTPALWNRGYATQALHAMVGYAQTVLFARMISAYVVGENQSSRRVLAKCGFMAEEKREYDGTSDGLYIYRLRLDGGEGAFAHV